MIAILLLDPKYPHNVGGALRAAACFGGSTLAWTGERVADPERWPPGARLPREERLRAYRHVRIERHDDEGCRALVDDGRVPVAVERRAQAERLVDFVHPERALYVFGPEDGSIDKGWLHACHRFVCIPTVNDGPLNLAAAVNVVLYDRLAKQLQG
ncbi:MAG TPA: TrmH family RNA methyltransferase [Gaiellaceae bacterium]|jgi:tRNA(Leu) C34 or U34 (ribose-2'-O)-methylase TrmL